MAVGRQVVVGEPHPLEAEEGEEALSHLQRIAESERSGYQQGERGALLVPQPKGHQVREELPSKRILDSRRESLHKAEPRVGRQASDARAPFQEERSLHTHCSVDHHSSCHHRGCHGCVRDGRGPREQGRPSRHRCRHRCRRRRRRRGGRDHDCDCAKEQDLPWVPAATASRLHWHWIQGQPQCVPVPHRPRALP